MIVSGQNLILRFVSALWFALRYYVLVNWAFKLKLGAFILGVRLLRVQRARVQGWGSSAGLLKGQGPKLWREQRINSTM